MRRAGAGWVGVLEKTTIRDKARSIWSRGAKRNIAKLVEVSWNHNIQYHRAVIQAIPATCRRALDVGCGRGALAQKLARRSDAVLAVDVDQECLMRAQAALHGEPRITFMQGDVLTAPLGEESFRFHRSGGDASPPAARRGIGTNTQLVTAWRRCRHCWPVPDCFAGGLRLRCRRSPDQPRNSTPSG